MNTTERNWSSLEDYEGLSFGLRSFFTREDWIAQAIEWHDNDCFMEDDEREEWIQELNEMEDEELMFYIQETWQIEIRETTWLKVGNKCFWLDPARETSGIYEIAEIRYDKNDWEDSLTFDTIVLLTSEYGEAEVFLREIYGLTDETCPKCGSPLYVSDLCHYEFVCLECDENFC